MRLYNSPVVGRGRIHGRGWALAALAFALLAATSGLGSAAPILPSPEEPGERMALRVDDLPPGYYALLGSEGGDDRLLCEDLEPSDPGKQLTRWVERYQPHGCIDGYYRLYRVPGSGPAPPLVGTGALETRSITAAQTGLALSPLLLAKLTDDVPGSKPLEEATPAEVIGDGTRLFHWRGVPRFLLGGRLGTFVVWRSGAALGTVLVTGKSFAAIDGAAIELAHRQQVHLASPTPYTEAERDTLEVPLDNPESNFPIHWLGRTFKPGHGLPATELVEASGPFPPFLRRDPGLPQFRLRYEEGPDLDLWSLPGWKRFSRSLNGREVPSPRCTTPQSLELQRGRAVIVATRLPAFGGCEKRSIDFYYALAFIGGTVITVNLPDCGRCMAPLSGPYNSLKGMKTIVRGLELRPKPVY